VTSEQILASPATGLVLYGLMVSGLVALLLAASSWLGERRPGAEKARPYESGVIPTGPARLSEPVPFYLVAMFFLVFDVEAVFIFAWAVAYDLVGWAGWLHMAVFIAVLLIGLLYVWRKGGLDWGPTRQDCSPIRGACSSPDSTR
jgi:NADH-quinone oxidoreductase subunit A